MIAQFNEDYMSYTQWKELRKAERLRKAKLIIQKLVGLFLIALPFLAAWITQTGDVSISVFTVPVGVALIFTRKQVLDI